MAATGNKIDEAGRLRTVDGRFIDAEGRTVMLRGVNLGGSTKMPAQPEPQPTHLHQGKGWDFFVGREEISFVGRPFPIDEADEHFARLRAWGFNCLRFLVTWEALEHAGPGKHDHEYIQYVRELLRRAANFGFYIYVDPHQDCWSRFTGGSGHPSWTLEVLGMDVRKLAKCGAAVTHQAWEGDPRAFPRMLWPTNAFKYACATAFTVFWAGDKFAPELRIQGEPAQHFLQRHYIAALAALAEALRGLPNVLGFGTMNEPMPGWVGWPSLLKLYGPLRNGHMPTAFEGMHLASGGSLQVGVYDAKDLVCAATGKPVRREVLNELKQSIWLDGYSCPWKAHGVWEVDAATGAPRCLKPHYFTKADFGAEHFLPFARKYAAAVRAALGAEQLMFIELPPADLKLAAFPHIAPGGRVFPPDKQLERALERCTPPAPNRRSAPANSPSRPRPVTGFSTKSVRETSVVEEGSATATAADDGGTASASAGNAAAGGDGGEEAAGVLRGCINAAHWYDNLTLYVGQYMSRVSFDLQSGRPVVGAKSVFRMMVRQLKEMRSLGDKEMGGVPTLIGEVGIPFDLSGGKAYSSGNYTQCLRAMDASVSALEEALLHFTLWCYTPDHNAEFGDNWNLEDLSIFSPELQHDVANLHSGGRATPAVARPFAPRVAGTPLVSRCHVQSGVFALYYKTDPTTAAIGCGTRGVAAHTEVFVPLLHYPQGFDVFTTDGSVRELPCPPEAAGLYRVVELEHATDRTHHALLLRPRRGTVSASASASARKSGGSSSSGRSPRSPLSWGSRSSGKSSGKSGSGDADSPASPGAAGGSGASAWMRPALPASPVASSLRRVERMLKRQGRLMEPALRVEIEKVVAGALGPGQAPAVWPAFVEGQSLAHSPMVAPAVLAARACEKTKEKTKAREERQEERQKEESDQHRRSTVQLGSSELRNLARMTRGTDSSADVSATTSSSKLLLRGTSGWKAAQAMVLMPLVQRRNSGGVGQAAAGGAEGGAPASGGSSKSLLALMTRAEKAQAEKRGERSLDEHFAEAHAEAGIKEGGALELADIDIQGARRQLFAQLKFKSIVSAAVRRASTEPAPAAAAPAPAAAAPAVDVDQSGKLAEPEALDSRLTEGTSLRSEIRQMKQEDRTEHAQKDKPGKTNRILGRQTTDEAMPQSSEASPSTLEPIQSRERVVSSPVSTSDGNVKL